LGPEDGGGVEDDVFLRAFENSGRVFAETSAAGPHIAFGDDFETFASRIGIAVKLPADQAGNGLEYLVIARNCANATEPELGFTGRFQIFNFPAKLQSRQK